MTADPLFDTLTRALAGRYNMIRELGRGGMAAVYLATDLKLGRLVAIKVLPPEARETLGAERFSREVRLVAGLSHPTIVPLFEADEAEGLLYYVMGYVEGESLAERLAHEGALPLEDALRITAEVGDALQYAHERNIIHRDIKPANVLLTRAHAMVTDFGIAKLAAESSRGETLTGTGVTIGTVEYMSPEQASGEKRIDARSDVYALAALLYEMLTGEPPFTGPTAQAIVARILVDPPRPIRTIRPNVPAHIERALVAALAKLPADRPPTAQAFVDLLVRSTSERPAVAGSRWRWAAVAASLVVLAGAAYVAAHVSRRGPTARVVPAGMVLVPGGAYLVGGGPDRPATRVQLDSFYIDSTEVTVAAYERYARATGAELPWRGWARRPEPDWPATGALWVEAQSFCRWRDAPARLPSEDEWEAAARGPQGRRYPWGDAWAPGRANAAGATDTLAPVGAFPLGRSWVGAVDLVGNAWEWTAAARPGRRGEPWHVIKGGAFNSPPPSAAPAHRAALPDERGAVFNTGFRCVRPAAP